MKIILGGAISVQPFSPGMVWNWMQLATGLQRLGHRVFYVEQVESRWCVDPQGRQCLLNNSINQELFRKVMERFGLAERACQIDSNGNSAADFSLNKFLRRVGEADLLINMSGHIKHESILARARRRAYVDQDPVYTQLWCAEYGENLNLDFHDVFLTVGLNIGTSATSIPDIGLDWHGVLPPVVLEDWPIQFDATCPRFTTIASWTGFGAVSYQGQWYESKYEEFMKYATLPEKVDQAFEVALRRYRDEEDGIQTLRSHGWHIFDSSGLFDLDSYQQYILQSRGEIGIAKNAYVQAHSGWFSDRSTHYLACGKPVLAQATGFEEHLTTGRGIVAFTNMEEAVNGVMDINNDYASHCRAARDFAHDHLDYRKVIPNMLDAAHSSPPDAVRA